MCVLLRCFVFAVTEKPGKFDEAEPLLKRSLAIDEKVYGPEHPEVATDLNYMGILLKGRISCSTTRCIV